MRHTILAFALLVFAPAAALAAGDRGFQLQADLVGSLPSGTYEFGGSASDLFDVGGSMFGRALFGVSRGLYVGAGVGYLRNSKDFTRTSLLDTRPSAPVSGKRTMEAIPALALIQVRTDTHHSLSWYGEGGVGFTTFDRRLTDLRFRSQALPPLAVFQQGLSYLVGGGACLGMGRNFELLFGASYLQAFTNQGPAWEAGDNPAFVMGSVGLRYPRW